MPGMHALTKSPTNEGLQKEAIESSYKILTMLGERLPRHIGDVSLQISLEKMNSNLRSTTDGQILSMDMNQNQNMATLMKIYHVLGHCFHFCDQSLICATSLRMVEITLDNGLFPTSPVAFSYYGEVLVAMGRIDMGVRLGKLLMF